MLNQCDDRLTVAACNCGSFDHWRPANSEQWLCWHCRPPPSAAFIAERRGPAYDAEKTIEPKHPAVVVSHGWSVCGACKCRWTVETFGPDGEIRCYGCSRSLTLEEIHSTMEIFKKQKPKGKYRDRMRKSGG